MRPPPRKAGRSSTAGGPPREVRIVGGHWKRSKLPVADSPGLRPTPDRVRETLFNWLGQRLDGWRVLDAFAGSGALGFEAASRGAREVLLLEREPKLVRALRAAAERLGAAPPQLQVQQADAIAWLRAAPPDMQAFDLVLLDPPFDAALLAPAIAAAAPRIAPGGWFYVEAGAPLLPAPPQGWRVHRQDRAGAVHFQLWRREG